MALRAREDKLASLIGGCMGNLIVDLNGTAEPNLAGLARGISNRPYKRGAYRTMFRCVSFVGKKNFQPKTYAPNATLRGSIAVLTDSNYSIQGSIYPSCFFTHSHTQKLDYRLNDNHCNVCNKEQ